MQSLAEYRHHAWNACTNGTLALQFLYGLIAKHNISINYGSILLCCNKVCCIASKHYISLAIFCVFRNFAQQLPFYKSWERECRIDHNNSAIARMCTSSIKQLWTLGKKSIFLSHDDLQLQVEYNMSCQIVHLSQRAHFSAAFTSS